MISILFYKFNNLLYLIIKIYYESHFKKCINFYWLTINSIID